MPPKGAGRSDIFQTERGAVGIVLPYIPRSWTIWESACGQRQIVRDIEDDGRKVVGTDIADGFDFMSPLASAQFQFDCIITNPPYSIKDAWLQRCFDIGKPFALLLPITALGEQGRVAMYRKNGIQLILPPGRIQFTTPNGKEGGSWFYAAWFCHGLDLPSQITIPEAA